VENVTILPGTDNTQGEDQACKKKDCFAAIERSIGGGRRNVRRLCAIAGVSRCGYYKYLSQDSPKQIEDRCIVEAIRKIQRD